MQAYNACMQTTSLARVLPLWSRQLWWSAIRPMYRNMQAMGLSLSESIVLRALQRAPLTVAEAAEHLCLSHSAASRAVDRLVEVDLVERRESPHDRRCRSLTLSPRGQQVMVELEATFNQAAQSFLSRLDEDEQQALSRLLLKMVEA